MEQQGFNLNDRVAIDELMRVSRKKSMATTSMVLGIMSIVLGFMGGFYISLPLGGMAIIIGCLSRGRDTLSGRAQAGIITGIIGVVLTLAIVISVVFLYLKSPVYRSLMNQVYEQNMGITLDEYIEQTVTQSTGEEFDIHQYLD